MALSVGVKTGSKIDVNGHTVLVKTIFSPAHLVVTVDDGPEISITDQESVTILPEVKLFAGIGGRRMGYRLSFEAPQHIEIRKEKVPYHGSYYATSKEGN